MALGLRGTSQIVLRKHLVLEERFKVESILVVDDEANMLVMLDRVLTNEGYTVHTAQDGVRALELVIEHNFWLAVLDVKMHPMDGLTLLEKGAIALNACNHDYRVFGGRHSRAR